MSGTKRRGRKNKSQDNKIARTKEAIATSRASTKKLIRALSAGDIVEGTVVAVKEYGVLLELGGFCGLIPRDQLTWNIDADPRKIVSRGQTLQAKVLKTDLELERVNLSRKALIDNTWIDIEKGMKIGDVLLKTVSRVGSDGYRIRLVGEHEGEIQKSEHQRLEAYKVRKGEEIWVRVVSMNASHRLARFSVFDIERAPGRAAPKDCVPMNLDALRSWNGLGIDARNASRWIHEGWSYEAASRWVALGVRKPKVATKWFNSSHPPGMARLWHGFEVDDAFLWIEAGFSPESAAKWKGVSPSGAQRWIAEGFEPAAAKTFGAASMGPGVCALWRDQGFTPSAAVQWAGYGYTAEHAASERRRQEETKKASESEEWVDSHPVDPGWWHGGE